MLAAVITVNSTSDDDTRDDNLTLREAILINNESLAVAMLTAAEQALVAGTPTNSDADTIAFIIAGAGVRTIEPLSALPTITEPVIIDGYTQPGASPNTNPLNLGPGAQGINATLLIELSGVNAGEADGLRISAGNSTVRGLVINRFRSASATEASIRLLGNGNNVIEGNFLGTDPSGTAPTVIAAAIVIASGDGNRIGTNADGNGDPAERNLIGGNSVSQLVVVQGPIADTVIQGNFVGTTVTGAAALTSPSLAGQGIVIGSGVSGTLLGGSAPGSGNVISGLGLGVVLDGAAGSVVRGNFIGTDLTGVTSLGTNGRAVLVANSPNTTIGGTTPAARNLISGNGDQGIGVSGASGGTVIQGNFIGTDITGMLALGNQNVGISTSTAFGLQIGGPSPGAGNVIAANGGGLFLAGGHQVVQGNLIGTAVDGVTPLGNVREGIFINTGVDYTIGGAAAGEGNIIAHNGEQGISINNSGNIQGVAILGNRLFNNTGLGIDLADNGATPNDAGDGDIGPNLRQNFAEFVSATLSGGLLAVRYVVPSTTVNSTYPLRVEFFRADSDGQEGQTFLHFDTYTAAEAGTTKTVVFTPAVVVALGERLVTTATDAANNSSEFSLSHTIVPNAPPTITSNGGGDTSTVSVLENSTVVTDVDAVDPNQHPLVHSIAGGADAARFAIDPLTGVLSFVAPPDFESPTDADGNNVYIVFVRVSDGSDFDLQGLAVVVLNVEEGNASEFLVLGADAAAKGRPAVKVFDAAGNLVTKFLAYEANFRGGVRVAVGDVNGDGTPEIITGPGRGRSPLVKVFDLAGNELPQFRIQAFPSTFKEGVFVAAGDVLGDGLTDIVVSPGRGKSEVRLFENRFNSTPADPFNDLLPRKFNAFPSSFVGGVTVATGDIAPGGKREVVVGSGSGIRATVKAFNVETPSAALVRTWLPLSSSFRGGVSVATARIDADGIDDLVVGAGQGGGSKVEIHSGSGGLLHSFVAYAGNAKQVNAQAAVRMTARDTNADGIADQILVGQGPDGRTRTIRSYQPLDATLVDFLLENDPDLAGGYFLA